MNRFLAILIRVPIGEVVILILIPKNWNRNVSIHLPPVAVVLRGVDDALLAVGGVLRVASL